MKKIIIILLLTSVFMVFFKLDPLRTYNNDKCAEQTFAKIPEDFNRESESFVVGSIVEAHHFGFTSGIGRLARLCVENPEHWFYNVQITYKSYIENKYYDEYQIERYTSQIGGQGLFYRVIDSLIYKSLGGEASLLAMQYLNIFLLGLTLAIISYYLLVTFNIYAMIGFMFGIVWNQWIPLSSTNLYWVTWSLFLPMAISCMIVLNNKKRKYFLPLLFISVFFKSSSGYEFISTTLVAMMIPLLGYEIMNFKNLKESFINLLIPSIIGVTAFISTLVLHVLRYVSSGTNLHDAIKMMQFIVVKRTHGSLSSIGFQSEILEEILKEPVGSVLMRYINATTVNIPLGNSFFEVKVWMFLIVIIIGYIYGFILFKKDKNNKKLITLLVISIVSSLAPLSWYVLAKAHSAAHPFVNTILWYVPYIPLSIAYIAYLISLTKPKTLVE